MISHVAASLIRTGALLPLLAFASGCCVPGSGGSTKTSTNTPSTTLAPNQVTSTTPEKSSGEVVAMLVMIQTGRPDPPRLVLERFARAFGRLEKRCPDPPERIGDFLVSGQQQLAERRKTVTLLELTESVATMLESAARSGGIPKTDSCAEAVALMVVGLANQ